MLRLKIENVLGDGLGYTELVATMPHYHTVGDNLPPLEQFVVDSARTSFNGSSKGFAADLRLLNYLYDHDHMTPFEMVQFVFRVKAPEMVFRQWVRHRAGTFNSQSGRYTPYKEELYVPAADQWRMQSATNKQGSSEERLTPIEGYVASQNMRHIIYMAYAEYERLLSLGVAKEQARLVLPGFSTYTTFVWRVDLRNLLGFLRLRMAEDAQYEIRQYANAVQELITPLVPHIVEKLS